MTPEIYDAVVKDRLKGKVKLFFKTFPLRSHKGSKENGLAFVAAQKLGDFWEFVLYFYQRYQLFSVLGLAEWAEAVGMDQGAFRRAMAALASRRWLVEMKKEGIVNNVGYDPESDPGERRNLVAAQPERAAELEQRLSGWLEETGALLPAPNSAYRGDPRAPDGLRRL